MIEEWSLWSSPSQPTLSWLCLRDAGHRGGEPESATLSRQGHHPRPHTVKLHHPPTPSQQYCLHLPQTSPASQKAPLKHTNPAFPLTRPQTPAAGPRPPIPHGPGVRPRSRTRRRRSRAARTTHRQARQPPARMEPLSRGRGTSSARELGSVPLLRRKVWGQLKGLGDASLRGSLPIACPRRARLRCGKVAALRCASVSLPTTRDAAEGGRARAVKGSIGWRTEGWLHATCRCGY